MKWLFVFALVVVSSICIANDIERTEISIHDQSILEISFSSGLRIEIEDLSESLSSDASSTKEPEWVYGLSWQPRDQVFGVGVETELVERDGRTVLKTRPSLRASKNFEGRNFEGSVFLKPILDHRDGESSAGLKLGVRIDF